MKKNVNFALEVHPYGNCWDIASAKRCSLEAVKNHPRFGFNYDPSHLGYQGVNYVKFIRDFGDRIFHAHMKDVWWGHGDGSVGVFGGHTDFTDPRRFWDFRSLYGHGDIQFRGHHRGIERTWPIAARSRWNGRTDAWTAFMAQPRAARSCANWILRQTARRSTRRFRRRNNPSRFSACGLSQNPGFRARFKIKFMTRKLRYGMVGGGQNAFIGGVHRLAANLDGQIELVAGAFSSDPKNSATTGEQLFLNPQRVYGSYQGNGRGGGEIARRRAN